MARLNEPIMATESLETLRRRFLRQNRDIARINSTQSLRIRGLENECARMLSENLNLRGQILRLETELSESRAQRIADHAMEIKEKMEAQLLEWGSMLASLGHEPIARHQPPRLPKRAKTRSSIGIGSSPRWRRRTDGEMEFAAQQEGRLPPLWENKSCPRETLNREEIMALCEEAAETNDSPDLGPPPVSRFVDEDPVKIDLPTKSPSAIRNLYALEDSPSAPARENLVEKRAEEAQVSLMGREETVKSDPAQADVNVELAPPTKKLEPKTMKPTPTPEPQPASQTVKAGLKRKASDEDEKENVQYTKKGGDVAKATKAQPVKSHTKDGVTNRPVKSLPPVRRDVQCTPANPAAITATRKPLGARNANEPVNSPTKSTKLGLSGDMGKAKSSTKREEHGKERVKSKKKPEDAQPQVPTPIKISAPEELPAAPVVTTIYVAPETMSAEPDLFAPSSPEPPVAPRESLRDTPPPTEISNDGETSRPSRRNRTAVSYAEPNLRDKMRRPSKQLLDAVAGEGRAIRRTSQSKQSGDFSSIKSEEKSQLWKELPSAVKSSAGSDIAASPLAQKISRSPPSAELPMSVVTDRKKRTSMAAREADIAKVDSEDNDGGDVYDFPRKLATYRPEALDA
ncbi:hypothetical protein PG994_001277 [Apiospora phragmitis]|uniref:Shugoshin n=1 Tax=Apiospora phragmitis TaxID=2905665 RepID=A0ABR1WT24_9PEZI